MYCYFSILFFVFSPLKTQVDFIRKVLSPDFTGNVPKPRAKKPNSKEFKCEICDVNKTKGMFPAKQKLIRHFLSFDSFHWQAAYEIGRAAFGTNKEYVDMFDILERKDAVKKHLKNKAAAQADM